MRRLAVLLFALAVSPAFAETGSPPPPPENTGAVAPVIGGSAVPEGKWRDAAAVLFGGQQGCTGILIAPSVVMTAAHCIDSTLDKVLIGTNSLAKPSIGETINVSRRLAYPQGKYDVGIVILANPSTITPRLLATGWAQSDIVDGARVEF